MSCKKGEVSDRQKAGGRAGGRGTTKIPHVVPPISPIVLRDGIRIRGSEEESQGGGGREVIGGEKKNDLGSAKSTPGKTTRCHTIPTAYLLRGGVLIEGSGAKYRHHIQGACREGGVAANQPLWEDGDLIK